LLAQLARAGTSVSPTVPRAEEWEKELPREERERQELVCLSEGHSTHRMGLRASDSAAESGWRWDASSGLAADRFRSEHRSAVPEILVGQARGMRLQRIQ
jgi:hypothetical protein